MARNRQRAKDRKQKLQRENVPGSLDHASGEVEQVEARIVAGAGGAPVDEHDEVDVDGAAADGAAADGGEALDGERLGKGHVATAPATRGRSGSRLLNFLRACWAELQRVQWPDRRQVGQATAVVLGFVVIAGAFLGLADAVAQRIVDFII
jgi:preprotein translocase SecE subunit